MSDLPLQGDQLDSAETIFDIFLSLFRWLKRREGSVLSLRPELDAGFSSAMESMTHLCEELKEGSQDLRERGLLAGEAKQKVTSFILGVEHDNPAPAFYGALVAIDAAFAPPARPEGCPLNRGASDRGQVMFLPSARLPYESGEPFRTQGTVGSRIENKLQHLTVILPGSADYTVEVVRVHDGLLAEFEARPSPRFGLVPFRSADDRSIVEVTDRLPNDPPYFRASASNQVELSARLSSVLAAAATEEVDVLVFPELSFTEDLLARLRGELKSRNGIGHVVKLVVAGTCREARRNVCHVIGPDGRDVWQQPKTNRFVLLPGELADGPAPIPKLGGVEDIDISQRVIRVADFPFGRLAVLVCVDFILPETHALLSSAQANCIVVPAMTGKARRFETMGWSHAVSSGATTFFCNAPNSPGFDAKARSFVHTPLKSPHIAHIGGDEPWERFMLVFSADEPRGKAVRIGT